MLKRLALIAFLAVGLSACSETLPREEKIENIVRVFWHEGTRYSFYIQVPGSDEISIREVYRTCTPAGVKIYTDVQQEKKMWAYIQYGTSLLRCPPDSANKAEIHIHDAGSIEGGGWNHGKFGSGQTHVIE